jgi:predicted RNase H-like nuclease (RuvC/YqgF family)
VLWQKKWRIQKERWYQSERNKEINVLKKESNSLSRILGEMKQELDVLTAALNAQQALERKEKKGSNDDTKKNGCNFHPKLLATIAGRKKTPKASKRG